MPVVGMGGGEGPGDPLGGQAARHLRVLGHVHVVIEVDEAVPDRLAEDQQHRQQEKAANGRRVGARDARLAHWPECDRGGAAPAGHRVARPPVRPSSPAFQGRENPALFGSLIFGSSSRFTAAGGGRNEGWRTAGCRDRGNRLRRAGILALMDSTRACLFCCWASSRAWRAVCAAAEKRPASA